jgi:hypothetical protein
VPAIGIDPNPAHARGRRHDDDADRAARTGSAVSDLRDDSGIRMGFAHSRQDPIEADELRARRHAHLRIDQPVDLFLEHGERSGQHHHRQYQEELQSKPGMDQKNNARGLHPAYGGPKRIRIGRLFCRHSRPVARMPIMRPSPIVASL